MEEAVRENPGKTVVGFEANGGFLLASDVVSTGHTLMKLPTRDSVLPVLLVLNAAAGRGKTVSELVAELPRRFTDSDLIREFPVTASAQVLSRLVEGGKAFIDAKWSALLGQVQDINLTDGVRVTFAGGDILHFRPSGNAPEFRIYSEADSSERAGEIKAQAVEWVRLLT
jgi:phosphomannomutase